MNRADIETVLAEHFRYGSREPELCRCGEMKGWAIEGAGPSDDSWEQHVADQLMPLFADVWDEGHHAGVMNATIMYDDNGQMVEPVGWRDNPYRKEATNE